METALYRCYCFTVGSWHFYLAVTVLAVTAVPVVGCWLLRVGLAKRWFMSWLDFVMSVYSCIYSLTKLVTV